MGFGFEFTTTVTKNNNNNNAKTNKKCLTILESVENRVMIP